MINIKKWVMIADADQSFRNQVSDLLQSHFGDDVKVIEASNGQEAMDIIKKQAFHLILTQLDLPGHNSSEIVASARENPFNEKSPIIITLTDPSTDQAKLEKENKFISCYMKPIDPFKFINRIKDILSIGSTENMISASIFSSLLDSSTAFLAEALKMKHLDIGEMQLKARGQSVLADQAAIITVFIGKVSNTFSILCDRKTLELIRDKSEKIAGTELDVISKSLGYVILKHVLTECGIIDSNQVHTKDITQDPSILVQKRGITITITGSDISYTIFATTQDETTP